MHLEFEVCLSFLLAHSARDVHAGLEETLCNGMAVKPRCICINHQSCKHCRLDGLGLEELSLSTKSFETPTSMNCDRA